MAKLEMQVLIGAESKEFLANLKDVVERLEALASGGTTVVGTRTKVTTKDESDEATDDAPGLGAETGPKARDEKAQAEAEEKFDLGEDETPAKDEDPEITKEQFIKACAKDRDRAIEILKKMKVKSVHAVPPAKYASFIEQLGA